MRVIVYSTRMAILEYNQIKERKYIVMDGEPYEVLSSHVFRKQQRKPVNQTKLKSLLSESVVEHSFNASDKVHEADLSKIDILFLFTKPAQGNRPLEHWFRDAQDPSKRFILPSHITDPVLPFTKEGSTLQALTFNDEIMSLSLPIKVTLKVTETSPNIKGNTAQGGNKPATLESGAVVTVPLFVEVDDEIRVNTQTGEYVERV